MSLVLSRILVPTDFSPCAGRALEAALELARRHGAQIRLLHVICLQQVDPYSPAFFQPDGRAALHRAEQASHRALAELLQSLDLSGVKIKPATLRGMYEAETIVDTAVHHDFDLVVMGTHGRRGLRRLVLGSVAEQVVREAPCPILTVREEHASTERILSGNVLVPVDFSDHAQRALRTGWDLVPDGGGTVGSLQQANK